MPGSQGTNQNTHSDTLHNFCNVALRGVLPAWHYMLQHSTPCVTIALCAGACANAMVVDEQKYASLGCVVLSTC
jgi:hypothetical protein